MPLQELVEDPTLRGAPTNSQFECRLPLPRFILSCFLFRGMVRNGILRVCSYFCSTERNSELFSLPLKGLEGISESLLFRGMIRNEILRVCSYFCSTERNSKLFSLPRKGLEGNSESLLLFQFHGTEFRVVFSSAEGFGMEFRGFTSIFGLRDGIPSCFLFRGRVRNGIPRISVPRNSRNSVGNNHLFRQFRLSRNYFFVGNSQPQLGSRGTACINKIPRSQIIMNNKAKEELFTLRRRGSKMVTQAIPLYPQWQVYARNRGFSENSHFADFWRLLETLGEFSKNCAFCNKS